MPQVCKSPRFLHLDSCQSRSLHTVLPAYLAATSCPLSSPLRQPLLRVWLSPPRTVVVASSLAGPLLQHPPDLHTLCPKSPTHLAPPGHPGVTISLPSMASPCLTAGTHQHGLMLSFYVFILFHTASLSQTTLVYFLTGFLSSSTLPR